ncbi:aminoglycoside phosphotransferase family protein [filamentous cyanobacterium LEGE 11480]|uniref:Aminoglycoside phosphotransferase family protein n=1 Tax=Romeriopsis navalis LEGE 11480 TaxID=2777977 RepID=A0A928Z2J3_9CYAN|nr:aminoglycoside phosphotransferase family protein [Romeriopsis navalis]MBE9028445.1 aminoglycoside phosphotransferase family protein [Romeriopsis navalis LEGE 11480]
MSQSTANPPLNWLRSIADQFAHRGTVTDIAPLGNGNINDTFLITVDSLIDHQFVLQRINTQVFQQPQLVMRNMRTLTEHIHAKLQKQPRDRRWKTPLVILTKSLQDHWNAEDGAFWRAISFIDGSEVLESIQDPAHAQEVGHALGTFHDLISNLPAKQLADTLEGFHITPRYLQKYNEILANRTTKKSRENARPEVAYCLKFVDDRRKWASVLETAKTNGKLPLRLMHGDPKVNNVMVDSTTQKAISLVDLDTVKPGLVHYDIGDCLRSGCNPLGEETTEWEQVQFEPQLCRSILQGYLSEARGFMTDNDYAYIFDAARLIAFELGLRFFTDYLAGDVYFKTKYPEHNLARALVQFKLTESIEAQQATIENLIQELR